MKLLYLTFYFEPDIGPGSFRNTALVYELSRQLSPDSEIHVVTTKPNRYRSFKPVAPRCEEYRKNGGCPIVIERVTIPMHNSGMIGQIGAFIVYFLAVHRLIKDRKYTLVVASSSRLFTAFLGAIVARRFHIPLFLDIRDIFREAILDVIRNPFSQALLNPMLRAIERYTFSYASRINLVSEGFRPYFKSFSQATYSYFTNGIDDEFLTVPDTFTISTSRIYTILYAGNIGEGQGLHKIIPQAARQLGAGYRFVIIGEGGAKRKLEEAIRAENVANVEIRQPVSRTELVAKYQKADYLFVHLNDLDACKRVLPSKLFELAATDKPILAGVGGYAASFVRKYISNHILFSPGDVASLVSQLREKAYYTQSRSDFRAQFQRKAISHAMAKQILETLERATATNPNIAQSITT